MNRISSVLVALALMTVSTQSGSAQGNDRYGIQNVVYHINYDGGDGDQRYKGALKNIQNHINAVGAENINVKVVLHSYGVGLLASAQSSEELQEQVLSLKHQNVDMHVCNNTLNSKNISYEDDLFDVAEVDIIPSGVAELSHLQMQGYTYIKP
ncbi:DsrE family protein [Roseobacter weihaiensis]|uniref:DsrE family protein n=1 Tax=Roseobacter weihaiensis TaxID=2763262 RepID=UPI001D09B6C0|nr:DsrE family protein [Roseobacter sp. H9]